MPATLPIPLTCRKCNEDFIHPISAVRLRELQEAGITPEAVAESFSTATLSQELTCPHCQAASVN